MQAEQSFVADIQMKARRAEARLQAPAAAPRPAPSAALANDDSDIVVTGTAMRRPVRRGDWDSCTVNDPLRRLNGCKRLVDPGAKGPAGRAGARVADGLSLAWQGNLDGAIGAFDQAIELQPHLAFAYLNRGLVRQRQGDIDGAIADLDQAVRYAPTAARGYYQRSVMLRERGDTRRAERDEERAIALDPDYDAVVK
jgi:tetratricopeptide (TPR) repeat protein